MRTDNVLRLEGMDALLSTLGPVDAERFITMIKRDTFDYTEWQRGLWRGKNIDEIHNMATAHEMRRRADTSARPMLNPE